MKAGPLAMPEGARSCDVKSVDALVSRRGLLKRHVARRLACSPRCTEQKSGLGLCPGRSPLCDGRAAPASAGGRSVALHESQPQATPLNSVPGESSLSLRPELPVAQLGHPGARTDLSGSLPINFVGEIPGVVSLMPDDLAQASTTC